MKSHPGETIMGTYDCGFLLSIISSQFLLHRKPDMYVVVTFSFHFSFFFFFPKKRSLPVWLNWHANVTVKNDKRVCLRIVYTWAFSFKNVCISTRLGLQSTLIRWAFSPKTHRFEIALESGSRKTHTYRISVDCRKHIKMKTIKVSQARVFVACT